MVIADSNLASILASLRPSDRQVVEAHIKGKRSDDAAVILRWIRRKLKRRVRSKRK